MSGLALTFMIAVCGLVWGGFLVLLTRAIGREAAKSSESVEGTAESSSGR